MATAHACFCVGPQNGQPLCPCRMRAVTIQGDRYVKIEDLGPVDRPWWEPVSIPTYDWPPQTASAPQPITPPPTGLPNPFPADTAAPVVVRDEGRKCPGCAIRLKGAMMYSCPRSPCPSGLGSNSTL